MTVTKQKQPDLATITFLNLTIHPTATLNRAIEQWIRKNQTTLDNIVLNITRRIHPTNTTRRTVDATRSHQAEAIMLMIRNQRQHPSKMLDCRNIAAYIHRNTNSRVRHAQDKLSTPASGMTNARRKQREAQHTVHILADQGVTKPTIEQIIETTNERLLATRRDPARSGILLTPQDLRTNWTENTTLEDWKQPTDYTGLEADTLSQCRIQLLNTLPSLVDQWLTSLHHPSPHGSPMLEKADSLFRAITAPILGDYPLPAKTGTATLNVITLGAVAGTLTYGYARAGLHPVLAIDSNPASLKIIAQNLNIPVLSPKNPRYERILEAYTSKPYILVAQPQNEEDYQTLARLVATRQAYLVTVWEQPRKTNPNLEEMLQQCEYTTSQVTVYSAKCGVPLNQYWRITIAALNPELTQTLTQALDATNHNPVLSLKDYWPRIPVDGVWRRQRPGWRSTTPISQPHPALPDALRRKPQDYQQHPNDVKGKTRALTIPELRHVLTIPDTYRLPTRCYQQLRRCVPPKVGWTVASRTRVRVEKNNQFALAA